MIELINVPIKEFKELIYPQYLKLFPEEERKSYTRLENSYNKGILKMFKIVNDKEFVGFIIMNTLENNKYMQLDYFAILPEYQNKGYGSKSLMLLKEFAKEYDGIFIEIEKVGLADTDEENEIRKKRASFYENIGFRKLNFDLELFEVIYSAYMLDIANEIETNDNKIIEDIFEIYIAIMGKDRVKEKCKVIKG